MAWHLSPFRPNLGRPLDISESHLYLQRASLVARTVKNLPAMQETWV